MCLNYTAVPEVESIDIGIWDLCVLIGIGSIAKSGKQLLSLADGGQGKGGRAKVTEQRKGLAPQGREDQVQSTAGQYPLKADTTEDCVRQVVLPICCTSLVKQWVCCKLCRQSARCRAFDMQSMHYRR